VRGGFAESVAGRILSGSEDGEGAFRIIVIAASAGGIAPLCQIIDALPEDLDAAIFVVVHTAPGRRSFLPEVINRHSSLPARHAVDGQPIEPGQVIVAPPDGHHMVLAGGRVRLVEGPREHNTRPAADPLFRSAAPYGRRTIGVVLSGLGRDGAAGAAAIKEAGGTIIVQSPATAAFRPMPEHAWTAASLSGEPDRDIAGALVRLSGRRRAEAR
jgi:two-component system chemotaxis response regulator CheB